MKSRIQGSSIRDADEAESRPFCSNHLDLTSQTGHTKRLNPTPWTWCSKFKTHTGRVNTGLIQIVIQALSRESEPQPVLCKATKSTHIAWIWQTKYVTNIRKPIVFRPSLRLNGIANRRIVGKIPSPSRIGVFSFLYDGLCERRFQNRCWSRGAQCETRPVSR